MSKFTVEIEGAEELIARLTDPDLVDQAMDELVESTGKTARSEMIKRLSGGTEQAKISTQMDYPVMGKPLTAKVYSAMPQARSLSIEEGRKSGETVPVIQVARWYKGAKYLTSRRLPDLSESEKETILKIRDSIKAKGVKGKKFIEGSADKAREELPRLTAKAARKIEKYWEGSRK